MYPKNVNQNNFYSPFSLSVFSWGSQLLYLKKWGADFIIIFQIFSPYD